jgi:carbonic anhydrase/acetyltransferase-like protein (isoleucine patch superfamily)
MGYEWNSNGDHPRVSRRAYTHPTAVLAGNVEVGDDVFVGPYAVLRADERGADGRVCPIVIGAGSNVQDGVIIHAVGGTGVVVGPGTSIAHGAVVHGPCEIGAGCFVGFRSVTYDSRLGSGTAVMHGCVVEGVELPQDCVVSSGEVVRRQDAVARLGSVDADVRAFMQRVLVANTELARWRLNRKDGG